MRLRFLVIRAAGHDQPLVQVGPCVVLQTDGLEDSKKQGDDWSPTEIRFECRRRWKVVDRTNGRNDRRRGDGPEAWKRQQDLPFTGMFDDAHNFAFQLLNTLTQKPKLFDLLLVDDPIFGFPPFERRHVPIMHLF